MEDFEEYILEPEEWDCTGKTDDLKLAAQRVNQHVEESGDGIIFGTMYDPVTYYTSWDYYPECEYDDKACIDEFAKNAKAVAKEEAEELLRLQVQDFIEWLKGQGVI